MEETKTNKLKNLLNKLGDNSIQSNLGLPPINNSDIFPKLKKAPQQKYYPLSSAQKRLFILNELAIDKIVYNIPFAIKIVGQLDVNKLKASFDKTVKRHDALRTTFELIDGQPVQIIHESINWEFEYSVSNDFDLEQALKDWVRPFDLERGPLFRIKLIKFSENHFYLLMDMHHIIVDAHSFSILIEELTANYSGLVLEPLQFNYRDYVIWQNELLESNFLKKEKSYWIKEFSSELPLLGIPTDFHQHNPGFSPGDRLFFSLDCDTTNALRCFANKNKVSLYMLLLSMYSVLLYRYTNEEEIIIGSSIEGRPDQHLRNIMGVFINTLPIKCQIHANKTYEKLLAEIKEKCLKAFENQHFPFDELTKNLPQKHHSTQNPIFQTLFDFHKASRAHFVLKDLSIEFLTIKQNTSKFDLSLEATENKDDITLFFEYHTGLYSKETIKSLADCFIHIIQELINDPKLTIGEISLFSKEKRSFLDSLFAPVNSSIPHYTSYPNLFKDQVTRSPNSIAAEDDNAQMTYFELDSRSTHLANQLKAKGIVPGDVVATCMDRSLDLLVSILSILKVGAAYLPIDPEYPLERANKILIDGRAKMLLSNRDAKESHAYQLPSHHIHELFASSSGVRFVFDIPDDAVAYVIFTSGSTGNPKGAMLTHRGMINHIFSKISLLELSEKDCIAQTSSLTFDVSIWQFLTILLVGGRVVIFNKENAWSPFLLLTEIEKKKVTVFETVPSHMHLILDVLENSFFPLGTLRWLMLNGEMLPVKIYDKWRRHYPRIPIVNAYGPTECSDDICHYVTCGNVIKDMETIPIGHMIFNMKGYILNESLSFMPPNCPGEFYAGGVGVGMGYVGQPDLTAEVFIPSPFEKTGERLYRTKDLVKYSLNGSIEYLGRIDRQVKFHGVRIELEEIEKVIKKHPLIQQAIVVLKKNISHELLVAYLIAEDKHENNELLSEELRIYLKEKLPSAMIPNLYLFLENFPLTASGKVNIKALPESDLTAKAKHEIDPPKTSTEMSLADLWKVILKLDVIGRKDHFFEKGGNSLLAIQLATKIRQHFSVEMPLHEIFSHPLLEEQALCIERIQLLSNHHETNSNHLPLVNPNPSSRYEPFPLTHVQHAYWLGRSGIFELGDVSVHVYTEYEKSNLNLDLLEKALNKLIIRHEALRMVLPGDGTQIILAEVPYYHIEKTDLSQASQEEIQLWTSQKRQELSHEVFPSNQWPLFGIQAALLPENSVRLYLSFDALIMDGWSVNNLVMEWMRFYHDIELSLPPLELSFRDYVLTLEKIKNTLIYQRDKDYWLSRLAKFPLAPPLPLMSSDNHTINQKFSRCTHRISRHLWDKQKSYLKKIGLFPTSFIAATFSEILALYSGTNHFTLNLTLFDRLPLHSQINDIIGDFTSIVLLEVNREGLLDKSFTTRIKALQQQLWQDLDHHLYSGIEFLRELGKQYTAFPVGSLMPVVLTSILGVEDNNYDIEQFLGQEVFGISQTPQLWLDYKAYELKGDLIVEWDYVSELFAPGFIQAMHASYCHFLTLLLDHDEYWEKASFSLLDKTEQKNRDSYNNTDWDIEYKPLPDLIYKQEEQYTQNPAVISQEVVLTYKVLYEKANQIGHFLSSQHIKPNQLVAIIMEKGWEQVMSCLGIMNAGAAYLPIDPHLPLGRIEEFLKLGEVGFVLTQKKWLNKLEEIPYYLAIPKEKIISSLDDISIYSNERQKHSLKLDDLAYVIFTSGSTGKPKGVMIEQQAVVNTILDLNERFSLQPNDRIFSLSNLNFDLSVYDIFGLLIAGGAIVFPDPDKIKEPSHWIDMILAHQITIWNTVPMFMQMLVEFLESASHELIEQLSKTLRLILLSGDWVPVDLPKKIRHIFGQSNPSLKIVSLGGATEASIWSIAYEIPPDKVFHKSIPYGYPLRNQMFYVLNEQLEPSPEGVMGELYIGGIGLARGYLNDQEKTQRSFIRHLTLGRIYKTGDLGKFDKENGIEFLGRCDSQVKIGGHRIELGEIESVLNSHKDIQQSIVLAVGENSYNKRLAAFIVPKQDNLFGKSVEMGIILDPQERTAFTMAQHGIRQFSNKEIISYHCRQVLGIEEQYFSRKSYRRFERKVLDNEVFTKWIYESIKPNECLKGNIDRAFSFEDLSSIIGVLSALKPLDQILPKYRYPSAGSLYPVQTYVSISHGSIKGIKGGVYYYDPLKNGLIYLGEEREKSHSLFTLHFIANLAAIVPLYGDLSSDFCVLEAGCMMRLIQKSCEEYGVSFHINPIGERDRTADFRLDKGEQVVCGLRISKDNANYTIATPSLYMYVKNNSAGNLSKGWYIYHYSQRSFKKMNVDDALDPLPGALDTYTMFQDAEIVLIFGMPKNINEKSRQAFLLQTGSLTQNLMEQGIKELIGLCPIGHLDSRCQNVLDVVMGKEEICNILFVGGISEEQVNSKEPSKHRLGVFDDLIKEHLMNRIPNYMVPASMTYIEKVPLTLNGKIDQKNLISKIDLSISKKKETQHPRNELEKQLVEIWKEILQVQEVGINDNFYELGGQSLLMTRIALKIRQAFEIELPLRTFFEATTIANLATFIKDGVHSKCGHSHVSSLIEDSQLGNNIPACHQKNNLIYHPQAVLLTGATGFLGTHLLQELLETTKAKIYCLIRADDFKQAKERLESSLVRYRIPIIEMLDRIVYMLGDLSKPLLGCSQAQYQELCNVIDVIYHNGAHVHHIYDYQNLRNSNVMSTLELIKLSALRKEKAIFYVSTLVAANDRDNDGYLEEDYPKKDPHNVMGGYQQTKWVSEKLLYEAHRRNIPIMIFRPNTITGHEDTGVCSYENDHFLRLVKGCMQLGYAPFTEEFLDLLPVNFVSKSIVKISQNRNAVGKVFNITSPHKIAWTELIAWFNKKGYLIQLIDLEEWKKLVAKITPENALFPLLSLYLTEGVEKSSQGMVRNQNMLDILSALNMDFPKITENRLTIYLNYLRKQGFYS